ncbi:hypothetical protein HY439_03245 [Candidatus Microgenomates bacterium]|nr:hypothetical protein [Candidatus Microgenomates bacterium]
MNKAEITRHLLTFLIYALIVFLAGRYFSLAFILFIFGGVIGLIVLFFDPIFSSFLSDNHLPDATITTDQLKSGNWREAIFSSFNRHQSLEQPILHSALFQIALMILGFYVITSGGSLFVSGLVSGMILHLIKEEFDLRSNKAFLKQRLFWNIHREISDREQRIYLGTVFVIFIVETMLLI